ncbi:signal peptide peptidase SppA [Tetragenococcus solitarius]|uniref:Signal peptide peptidase SppA n=1 Tax=Tetragenococcus solitarius TaxID=71453 RepID=A0ABN3Y824_9ENTE|nr:signal peptide peptidase SppA [Tetragenococcus solitarius]
MNKRRWVAIFIAAGLFIFATIASFMSKDSDEETLSGMDAVLFGSNEIEEKIVEKGNEEKRIAQLSIDGTIADTGENSFFSGEEYNHQFFLDQLKEVQEDPTVAAVLLEVNTPGGGVYESAEIAKEIQAIQSDDVPVYVSMKNMGASGGYYVSASADKIFATSETLTGSIGVIMFGMNFSELMENLGIEDQTYKSGPLKDMGSAVREPTEEDDKVMQEYVDNSYDRFVEIVANGRDMTQDQVRKLADGRIYDGQQAKENHLVDEIGFPEDALTALKKDEQLKNAQVFEYDVASTGFDRTWLGAKIAQTQGFKQSESERMLNIIDRIGTPEAPKPMYYYGGE